ncbi:MAG: hypothetical protein K0S07_1111 [Chlamydiales bacterium]|jgi:hypothetical protein|nr:hypothetical protein [Chlamydiales bacterium]
MNWRFYTWNLFALICCLSTHLSCGLLPDEPIRAAIPALSETDRFALKEHYLSTEEPQEEPLISAKASQGTFHQGQYHNLSAVSYAATTVALEDGSEWEIRFQDRAVVYNWQIGSCITIKPAPWYSSFDYVLQKRSALNATDTYCEEAEAILKVSPIFYGDYSLWIKVIDYQERKLILNDGSIWSYYSSDDKIMNGWKVEDHVIIGINDGFFTQYSYPNILIHAHDSSYTRAACLN